MLAWIGVLGVLRVQGHCGGTGLLSLEEGVWKDIFWTSRVPPLSPLPFLGKSKKQGQEDQQQSRRKELQLAVSNLVARTCFYSKREWIQIC